MEQKKKKKAARLKPHSNLPGHNNSLKARISLLFSIVHLYMCWHTHKNQNRSTESGFLSAERFNLDGR